MNGSTDAQKAEMKEAVDEVKNCKKEVKEAEAKLGKLQGEKATQANILRAEVTVAEKKVNVRIAEVEVAELKWSRAPEGTDKEEYKNLLDDARKNMEAAIKNMETADLARRAKIQDVAELNERILCLEVEFKRLKVQAKYTTRSGDICGRLMKKDLENGEIEEFSPKVLSNLNSCPSSHELENSTAPDNYKTEEDRNVNFPMHLLLRNVLTSKFASHLTALSSPLKDYANREHRADITITEGGNLEWPTVITIAEGKNSLEDSEYHTVLGQAYLRATAIAKQQPWRKEVIIPFYSLKHIGFLHYCEETAVPKIVSQLQLLPCVYNENGTWKLKEGFRLWVDSLNESPSLFGYEPYPVKLAENQDAFPVCLRSYAKGKAIFRCEDNEVLKLNSNEVDAIHEFNVHKALSSVNRVVQLGRDAYGQHNVLVNDVQQKWTGFALLYYTPLTPSTATIPLFRSYANTLKECADIGYSNNDISPDNLYIGSEGNDIIGDWEFACTPGGSVQCSKLLYDPSITDGKTASLVADLERLFYCAGSCALLSNKTGEEKYQNSDHLWKSPPKDRNFLFGLCKCRKTANDYTVLFGEEWGAYLYRIRQCLNEDAVNESDVFAAFCSS